MIVDLIFPKKALAEASPEEIKIFDFVMRNAAQESWVVDQDFDQPDHVRVVTITDGLGAALLATYWKEFFYAAK